jgi:hypothetical protein
MRQSDAKPTVLRRQMDTTQNGCVHDANPAHMCVYACVCSSIHQPDSHPWVQYVTVVTMGCQSDVHSVQHSTALVHTTRLVQHDDFLYLFVIYLFYFYLLLLYQDCVLVVCTRCSTYIHPWHMTFYSFVYCNINTFHLNKCVTVFTLHNRFCQHKPHCQRCRRIEPLLHVPVVYYLLFIYLITNTHPYAFHWCWSHECP